MIISRAIQKAFADEKICGPILVPVLQSEIEAAANRQHPFDRFTEAQMSELLDELRHSDHSAIKLINDGRLPVQVRSYFDRFSNVVLLDDTFLAMQLRGRRSWLVFDADEGADVKAYIQAERRFLLDQFTE